MSIIACIGVMLGCEKQDTTLRATMHRLSDTGMAEPLGDIALRGVPNGIEIAVSMTDVPTGLHGMHIHVGTSCGPNGPDGTIGRGLAAGAHYDPRNTGTHKGPGGGGHAGDLPVVYADERGNIDELFIVSKFNLNKVRGRAIIIHDGGDNYSDTPQPLGGGGGRYACGILE